MAAREIDPRVVAGLRRQHEGWRALLGNGAERVGWKIGINDPPGAGAASRSPSRSSAS